MSDVEIRPTIPTDLDALADVLVQVHASDGYPVEGVDDARAWVNLPEALGQWTAVLGGAPVGHVALLQPMPDDASVNLAGGQGYPTETLAVLARLFTAPSSRGAGVADLLMCEAEQHARQIGYDLVLEVLDKDQAALHLYRRRGWRSLGSIAHPKAPGETMPSTVMTLPATE